MSNIAQGEYLRTRRETLRRSQRWLAEAAGVSVRTVMRAEGGRDLASETLVAICAALDVGVGSVPSDRGPPGSAGRIVDGHDRAGLASAVSQERPWFRRPVPVNALCAAAALVAFTFAYDASLLRRKGPVLADYYELTDGHQVGWAAYFVALLASSLKDPEARRDALATIGNSGVTYVDCRGNPGESLREKRHAGGCIWDSGKVGVSEDEDGTTTAFVGPLSAAAGAGLTALLRSQPEFRLEARSIPAAPVDGTEVPGPWFEPNLSADRPTPPFPEGGRLEVRLSPFPKGSDR